MYSLVRLYIRNLFSRNMLGHFTECPFDRCGTPARTTEKEGFRVSMTDRLNVGQFALRPFILDTVMTFCLA
jgi:hypothetical protein